MGILHKGSCNEARQQGKQQKNCPVQETILRRFRQMQARNGRWASKMSQLSWPIQGPERGSTRWETSGPYIRTTDPTPRPSSSDSSLLTEEDSSNDMQPSPRMSLWTFQGSTRVLARSLLDGAAQHRAKIVREAIEEMNGEVRLVFLPPGCPDLNAIEEVWRQIKHAVLDTPIVKFHKMCEDIDIWLVESLPRLRKVSLQNCIVQGSCWYIGDRAHVLFKYLDTTYASLSAMELTTHDLQHNELNLIA